MLKKFPDVSRLATNNAFNTKISEVEKVIPDDANYITTDEFNKFSGSIFDERLKKAK